MAPFVWIRYPRKAEIAQKKKLAAVEKLKNITHLKRGIWLCLRYIIRPGTYKYEHFTDLLKFFKDDHNNLNFQRRMWFRYKVFQSKIRINQVGANLHVAILICFLNDALKSELVDNQYGNFSYRENPNKKWTYPAQVKFVMQVFREIAAFLDKPRINVHDKAIDTFFDFNYIEEISLNIKTYPKMLELFRKQYRHDGCLDLMSLRLFAQQMAEDKQFLDLVRMNNHK